MQCNSKTRHCSVMYNSSFGCSQCTRTVGLLLESRRRRRSHIPQSPHLISSRPPRERRTNTRTHHQRAHRAILDDLRADDRGAEEGPERGGDEAGVDRGDGCECCRSGNGTCTASIISTGLGCIYTTAINSCTTTLICQALLTLAQLSSPLRPLTAIAS